MLRTKLETMIPGAYGKVAKIIAENRVMVREKLKQSQSNKIFWEQMLNSKFLGVSTKRTGSGSIRVLKCIH